MVHLVGRLDSLFLAMEERPRWAVGSVNLGVTVVTGASHDLVAVETSSRTVTKPVALRAQPRPRNLQHGLID